MEYFDYPRVKYFREARTLEYHLGGYQKVDLLSLTT